MQSLADNNADNNLGKRDESRDKANRRLAIILGIVALVFYTAFLIVEA